MLVQLIVVLASKTEKVYSVGLVEEYLLFLAVVLHKGE